MVPLAGEPTPPLPESPRSSPAGRSWKEGPYPLRAPLAAGARPLLAGDGRRRPLPALLPRRGGDRRLPLPRGAGRGSPSRRVCFPALSASPPLLLLREEAEVLGGRRGGGGVTFHPPRLPAELALRSLRADLSRTDPIRPADEGHPGGAPRLPRAAAERQQRGERRRLLLTHILAAVSQSERATARRRRARAPPPPRRAALPPRRPSSSARPAWLSMAQPCPARLGAGRGGAARPGGAPRHDPAPRPAPPPPSSARAAHPLVARSTHARRPARPRGTAAGSASPRRAAAACVCAAPGPRLLSSLSFAGREAASARRRAGGVPRAPAAPGARPRGRSGRPRGALWGGAAGEGAPRSSRAHAGGRRRIPPRRRNARLFSRLPL